ncbi:Protein Y39B6A.41 [Aphelenchoides avenae]|nr:Protein Y39B6A.41 [Aphelenchus avenae]
MMFAGILVGAGTMGFLMDTLGRKATAVYVRGGLAVLSAFSMMMAYWTTSMEFFVLGHFLQGIAGAYKMVFFIYLAECAPDSSRGFATMALGSGSSLMVLAINPLGLESVFGTDDRWWLLPAICFVMSLFHMAVASTLPESPKHTYIAKDDIAATHGAIRFYHGDDANVEMVEEEYEREMMLMHHGHVPLKEVLSNQTLRWCLTLTLICGCVPAMSAINVKSQYLESMLMTFGMNQSQAVLAMTLMQLITAPLCFLSPVLVEKCGRRPLFLSISAMCCFEWAMISCAQVFVDWHIPNSTMSSVLGVIGCSVGQAAIMLGLLQLTPILLSEMVPHTARSTISQITMLVPVSTILLIVFIYPVIVAHFGALFDVVSFVISAVLLVLLYIHLPETRGMPVDQIVRGFYARILPENDDTRGLLVPSMPTTIDREYGSIGETSSTSGYGEF